MSRLLECKKGFTDDVMDLPIAPEPEVIANVKERMPQVKFSEANPEVKLITPYSQIDGRQPSRFVFHKHGRKISLDSLDCPPTGLSKEELRARRRKCSLRPEKNSRGAILRKVLVDGSAWEPSTADIIMKVSKEAFKPKRVGAKAAKALEFESKGEMLNDSEATLFRALAARAGYLAMDRHECAYAANKLCRFFATSTKTGVEQLKRLIRYLLEL